MRIFVAPNNTLIMAKRILIVDDEPDICEILRFNLEMEGHDVFVAEGADEGQEIVNRQLADSQSIDLILLDVMMTPKSGFEWANELKSHPATASIPIIFCTAKTLEEDLLQGFAIGSDDYICKPFRVSEVKARVKAVLKRTAPLHPSGPLSTPSPAGASDMVSNAEPSREVAHHTSASAPSPDKDHHHTIVYTPATLDEGREGIVLDLDRKECYVDGVEVAFTKLEFELLALLLSKPGQVFSREKILHEVWPSDTIVLDRTVDVNITRIRKKIGEYGKCLRTKFGYGYMFSDIRD